MANRSCLIFCVQMCSCTDMLDESWKWIFTFSNYQERMLLKSISLIVSYLEIIKFLSKYHDISISLRQLHRILRNLGLFRRKQHPNVIEILLVLRYMLKDSISSLGYWSMYQKLRRLGYITNKKNTTLLKTLDEFHVALR